ncbi:MAG TPA: hypothetical protein VGB32_10990 [Candidatus Bathyarchaeia archaeon]
MALTEFAQKSLQRGDQVRKTYSGKMDGNYGHLMISDQKLLFIKEEGFLRKSRNVVLNLPLEKVGDVRPASKYELNIVESEGGKHSFVVDNIPITVVEKSINEALKK